MNILLLGSGGREHALAWKIAQSALVETLYVAPGNAGTAEVAINVDGLKADDFEGVARFVLEKSIDMLVVGPEDPLVKGVSNYFATREDLRHIPVIGPSQQGAQLEGSKDFAKAFMKRHGIPTAAYETFDGTQLEAGQRFLETLQPPYVLKADGLCAGKGVLILDTLEEAQQELANMLGGKFGNASARVVIEEFLSGIECSVFVLTDGRHYQILPEAKDYKRIGVGDTGLNTGGMGSVSPVPFADKAWMQRVEDEIIRPTVEGLAKDDLDYKGFIFFGLINTADGPKVIEYNCRMGDPETEVVMPRLKSDLVALLEAAADGTLDKAAVEIDPRYAVTVMMVSGGYPEAYEKGKVIEGLDAVEGSVVFHAGTARNAEGQIITSGGRVLAVTSYGESKDAALAQSFANIKNIKFDKSYFRSDIGFDLK
ncbi:MAG: phosphoribosylamine--glycine ligase [Sodaliphilus sp.]|nr:phosphoribosylamine--glycine ligase [Sodaliphilus sp.]